VLLLVTPFAEDAFAQRGGDGGLPAADIQLTCRESEKSLKAIFGESTAVTYDGCITQEQAAREQLVKDWASYAAADRQRCAIPKQYMPSYVEWLTCFEMARDVRRIRLDQLNPKK